MLLGSGNTSIAPSLASSGLACHGGSAAGGRYTIGIMALARAWAPLSPGGLPDSRGRALFLWVFRARRDEGLAARGPVFPRRQAPERPRASESLEQFKPQRDGPRVEL